jgi:hypothetical protein
VANLKQEFRAEEVQTVSCASTSGMGIFARLAQAAYLLGKVQRHRRDPTEDPEFNEQERIQIDRSLRALLRLSFEADSVHVTDICPQTMMCFEALIQLHYPNLSEVVDPHTSHRHQRNSIEEALVLLKPIVAQSTESTNYWFRNRLFTMEEATPLLLPCTYQAAVTFLHLANWLRTVKGQEHGDMDQYLSPEESERYLADANHGTSTMTHKLSVLGHHWCAAGLWNPLIIEDAHIR